MRFPEFEEEWKRTFLSKESIINPKTPALENEFVYIDLESVVKGELINVNQISKSEAPSRAQRVLSDNDILFQCVRPYQLNNYIYHRQDNRQWVASTGYAQIRTKHSINFFYQLLNTPQFNKEVILRCTGTSYPAIASTDLGNIPISICSKTEQAKIGRFLSLLDERIETQNKIIEKLESLIRGLNNHLHGKYANDIEISLTELGKFYNGLSGKSGDDFGSGKPYVTYINVYQNNIIDESMIGYVKISDEEKQNTLDYGDALFTISSETPKEVGISSIYLGRSQELYLNSFCFGYRLNDFTILNPQYMPYCFSSHKFRKFVYPLAQGSTRFNLHMCHFANKKFKIPTIQNQLKIRKLLDSTSEKLRIEKLIHISLKEQKSFLLKKLFI